MSYCSTVEPVTRKPVTLARVFGVEAGRGYVTVEVVREDDARGAHMKYRVKRRNVRRVGK